MGTIADLVPRVREALSVDSSYDTDIIPFGIQRTMTRFLRDYHFPLAVNRKTYTGLAADQQDYTLPQGFKKELLVQFYDTGDKTYTEPLLKSGGFVLPDSDGVPRRYWMWNNHLTTDIQLSTEDAPTTNLILWYESVDWEANESWMVDNFSDMLFTFSTFRIAAEKNKPELAQLYGQLWQDDRESLAIYLNELEFGNGLYMQREARGTTAERYGSGI